MKKILVTANLDSFFIKFLIPYLKFFKEKDYEVHIATKSSGFNIPYCNKFFEVDFARSLNIKQNLKSYIQLKKVLKEEFYDIIFCHTPLGGAITRIASIKYRKKGTKIIYVAHGFHFFKGAPLKNWLLFFSTEKFLSRYTDIILTMNYEDYENASKKFKTKVETIPGIGLNLAKFDLILSKNEKDVLLKSLNLDKKDFIGIYAAEISKNKGQVQLIKGLEKVIKKYSNIHILLPGKDLTNGECQKTINTLGLNRNVHLLGFRDDIPQLLKISNFAFSSSKREGLPLNILEAMYCQLPIIAYNCRGMQDLIIDGENGYLVPLNNNSRFNERLIDLYNGHLTNYANINKEIISKFSVENSLKVFYEACKEYID
ncbi:MAG: glycosyltransferase family 4 protein [Bacilli bacterium]